MTKKIKILIVCILCIICLQIFACGAAYLSGVRVFVIQPIGAVPEGATVIISGVEKLNAIDSPDAVCDRYGTVNLIFQPAEEFGRPNSGAARMIADGLLFRFSEILYLVSIANWCLFGNW